MKSCNADMHAGKSAATKSGNNLKYHSALVSLLSGGVVTCMFKGLVLEEFLDLNLAVSLCLEFFNLGLNQKESVILLLTIPSNDDEVVRVTC